ncbi:MAG: adenylate/guanylate cyclase domain-containing protein, partial [Bacteroidia bacterium]|nr:adenylate/guanylate cyclase domain-containing protein [Bacteroidia bacterium]
MELKENSHQLLATLFADIQGYTALMQNNEELGVRLVEEFKTTLTREVEDHGGRVIQFYGDAIMAVFPSSVDAVSAAEVAQKAFNSAGDIPVRIGINCGDVLYREGNIFGDSVNIASRIESMGVPGSVLLSKEVEGHIKNKQNLITKSLGVFEFKNVNEGIEVFALTSPGITRPLPTQLKGKFKRGFQVKEEKTPEQLKLERNRKIAKVALPLGSTIVLMIVVAFLVGGGATKWILLGAVPIFLTMIGRIISIQLYDDPDALKKEAAKDKLDEKKRQRQEKRQAKIDSRNAKRAKKGKVERVKPAPPPIA